MNKKTEQLIALTNKALVCLGLLCSDDCPDAQTRLNDRGGVKVVLGVLSCAVQMCSTSTGSAGIGATTSNSGSSSAASVATQQQQQAGLSREQRSKHSAALCKWACWCLFVSSTLSFVFV